MKWEIWSSTYSAIVSDFGFDTVLESAAGSMGRTAALSMENVLKGSEALDEIRRRVRRRCIVTGNSPGLMRDLQSMEKEEEFGKASLVASDSSCGTLAQMGLRPDIIVTDADGDIDTEREMNSGGSLMVVHFHGDNYTRAAAYVLTLRGKVVITTQSGPTEYTFNFGGFTDGDRAVLLCEEFGAEEVILAGFDFGRVAESGYEGEIKLRKLKAARVIIDDASRRKLIIRKPGSEA